MQTAITTDAKDTTARNATREASLPSKTKTKMNQDFLRLLQPAERTHESPTSQSTEQDYIFKLDAGAEVTAVSKEAWEIPGKPVLVQQFSEVVQLFQGVQMCLWYKANMLISTDLPQPDPLALCILKATTNGVYWLPHAIYYCS